MIQNNLYVAATQARAKMRRPLQARLLSAFDEIAQTCLEAVRESAHTHLQSYLDGAVVIGDACFTRRAILLAIHDMKEELAAPAALQERVLADLLLLNVWPAPEPRLYRDIATALLRMEVVTRFQALRDDEISH
jgi:hypothetical protein